MVSTKFSLHLFSRKKCEISRKSLRNANENFGIFLRNVSFAGNPNSNTKKDIKGIKILLFNKKVYFAYYLKMHIIPLVLLTQIKEIKGYSVTLLKIAKFKNICLQIRGI